MTNTVSYYLVNIVKHLAVKETDTPSGVGV